MFRLRLLFIFLLLLPALAWGKPVETLVANCKLAIYKDRTDLENFAKKKTKSAAQAYYCIGEISRKQFIKAKDRSALKQALVAYETVARKYSGSGLAADSLLALGDLRRTGLKDEIAARAAYFEVIDRYPKSAAQAKKRLNPNPTATPIEKKVAEPKIEQSKDSAEKGIQTKNILVEKPLIESTPTVEPTATTLPRAAVEPIPTVASLSSAASVVTQTPTPGTGQQLVLDESAIPKRPLIVIDPGHGGEDQGAKGVEGLLEKNVVLQVSKELDQLLRDRLRAKTFLTRTTDVFIPLADRTKLANDRNADLFVSIHANASEFKTAQGIETYYLDNTKEKSSLKLADRENASLNFGPKQNNDLSFIFSDLIQNVKLDDSISLAHQLQGSLTQTLSRYYQGVNNLGVKKAPFYVLVGAHMPCVLVEISFIDHPLEGKRMGEERYQKLIAQSLYEGIRKFFIKREVH
jgi:N-acetylmuramoyl-L-alanine amidase